MDLDAGFALILSVLSLYWQFLDRRRKLAVSILTFDYTEKSLRLSVGFANGSAESILIQQVFLSFETPAGGHVPHDTHNFMRGTSEPLPATMAPKSVTSVHVSSEPFTTGIFSNLQFEGTALQRLQVKAYLNVHLLTSRGLVAHRRIHCFTVSTVGKDIMGLTPGLLVCDFFKLPPLKRARLPITAGSPS